MIAPLNPLCTEIIIFTPASIIAAEAAQIPSPVIKPKLAFQLVLRTGNISVTSISGSVSPNAKITSLEMKTQIDSAGLLAPMIILQITKRPCVLNTVLRSSPSTTKMLLQRLLSKNASTSVRMEAMGIMSIKLAYKIQKGSLNALDLTSETLCQNSASPCVLQEPTLKLHQRNVFNFVLGQSMRRMRQGHARQHVQMNTLLLIRTLLIKDACSFVPMVISLKIQPINVSQVALCYQLFPQPGLAKIIVLNHILLIGQAINACKPVIQFPNSQMLRLGNASLHVSPLFSPTQLTTLVTFCVPMDTSEGQAASHAIRIARKENLLTLQPDCV